MGSGLVLGAGFNFLQFPNERRGCQNFSFAMYNYPDFSNEHELLDIHLMEALLLGVVIMACLSF